MTIIILILVGMIAIHYFIYPAFLFIASRFVTEPQRTSTVLPKISMIVAAYNEQRVIEEKIANVLGLEYPAGLLELIVVSDGSNDKTPDIVNKYKDKGIIGLHKNERQGKTAALNRAVAIATGDILIFSDANSFFAPNAIKELLSKFHNEKVGGVCGRKAIVKNYKQRMASMGDNSYWSLESKLKSWQSLLGGITNADGEIFALRKNLYPTISPNLINDDQIITFEVIKQGKIINYASDAVTFEEASITLTDDFNVKRRMICGAFQAIATAPWVINPLSGWFGFNFFLHKFLRYIMFALLSALFIFSLIGAIMGNILGLIVVTAMAIFCVMAFIGKKLIERNISIGLFYLPYYYLLMNYACYKGLLKHLEGTSINSLWVKADR